MNTQHNALCPSRHMQSLSKYAFNVLEYANCIGMYCTCKLNNQRVCCNCSVVRPHVQNQGLCATCVNAAISSAAEAAAAVEAGTNTSGIAFSPVYAYYCEPTMLRSCASGWTLKDALDGLASATVRYLPHATCTHNVDLERIRTVAPSQLPAACDAVYNKCLSLRLVSECTYTALTDFWEIQRAIRLSGAAITRVSVGADFVEYFQSNPRGIYNLTSITNSSGTVPHAVILVS